MYGRGIQLYCATTMDDRETWLPTMRHIALEGRCFVLSANQFARRGDYPADYPIAPADPDTVLIGGGSCIVDPAGRVLAGPARDGETILTANLDLDEIARHLRPRRGRPLRPPGCLPPVGRRSSLGAGHLGDGASRSLTIVAVARALRSRSRRRRALPSEPLVTNASWHRW